MFIRTERLFLRPGWPEDMDAFLQAMGGDPVARNIGVSELPHSADEMRDYLERPRAGLLQHFFVHLRDSLGAPLVGGVGLGHSGDEQADGELELGYWIAREHRGHGYAAEAVRAVLAQARMLGHQRVVASRFARSRASVRVLERSGFRATAGARQAQGIPLGAESDKSRYVAELADKLGDRLGLASARHA